jgi:hypothetical protein
VICQPGIPPAVTTGMAGPAARSDAGGGSMAVPADAAPASIPRPAPSPVMMTTIRRQYLMSFMGSPFSV